MESDKLVQSDLKLQAEIFRSRKDRIKWKNHIQYFKQSQRYSPELKVQLVEALSFLANELPSDFLKSTNSDHQIHSLLWYRNEDTLWELVSLIKCIQHLKTTALHYDILLKNIRSTQRYRQEGRPFIEIAQAFHSMGFEIDFVPTKEGKLGEPRPDIVATLSETKEQIYIEVSRLGSSEENKRRTGIYRYLVDYANENNWAYDHHFTNKKEIPGELLREQLAEIDSWRDSVWGNREFSVFENEYVRLAYSHPDRRGEFEKWLFSNGHWGRGGEGIPLQKDVGERLGKNRINAKAKKFKGMEVGLIVFPVEYSFFLVTGTAELNTYLEKYVDELSRYPNVYGVLLYSDIGRKEEAFSYKAGENEELFALLSSKTIRPNLMRKSFFVANPGFDLEMSDKFWVQLMGIFIDNVTYTHFKNQLVD